MFTIEEGRSPLIEALQKLNAKPAIAVCKDTEVAMPTPRFFEDLLLTTHIARSTEGFAFLPYDNMYRVSSLLQGANEAWRQDKLPVVAVCAFPQSHIPFQRQTGIQADFVDEFLKDLSVSQRIVASSGESSAYVIRHQQNTVHRYDETILPAHANLVIHKPRAMAPEQLTALFQYVASVQGKVILCDDRHALANAHPELKDFIDGSLSQALTREFMTAFDPKELSADARKLPSLSSLARSIPNGKSLHGDVASSADPTPTNNYLVYHSRTGDPGKFPDDYMLVAKVDAIDAYCAFLDTVHFGRPWTENPGVASLTDKPRSTQPGDIICHNDIIRRVGSPTFASIERIEQAAALSQQLNHDLPNLESEEPEPDKTHLKMKF